MSIRRIAFKEKHIPQSKKHFFVKEQRKHFQHILRKENKQTKANRIKKTKQRAVVFLKIEQENVTISLYFWTQLVVFYLFLIVIFSIETIRQAQNKAQNVLFAVFFLFFRKASEVIKGFYCKGNLVLRIYYLLVLFCQPNKHVEYFIYCNKLIIS